jgi:geranylgeranyl diphosphate synthase type II
MDRLLAYQKQFVTYLESQKWPGEPKQLYTPITYILSLGGKRLRPVLSLMSAHAFGGKPEAALPAAMAVELFHNFTLLHDDIMDEAPLRRGQPTVHSRWDNNTAILSGDALMIASYQALDAYSDNLHSSLTRLLSQTAIAVCEGQQHDMDFEKKPSVSEAAYLNMIGLKTAVLLGCALQMGAIVAGASPEAATGIYQFGYSLGVAFQIQDDYLDAFGDPKTFGKQVGGDIIENKKTMLYHLTLQLGSPEMQESLLAHFQSQPEDPTEKIKAVKELFSTSGAQKACAEKVHFYTEQALEQLKPLPLIDQGKNELKEFARSLMARSF